MYGKCQLRKSKFKFETRKQLLILRASAFWNILQLSNRGQNPTTFMLESMNEIIQCVCLQ